MQSSQFFLEPIPYSPHIVSPLGYIVTANGKVRNVLDASKTGFNDCLRKLFVRFSTVENVVKYPQLPHLEDRPR